jgi:5-methylcytosine-specific restriction endonuclease McrBC regulatory subunit McrC
MANTDRKSLGELLRCPEIRQVMRNMPIDGSNGKLTLADQAAITYAMDHLLDDNGKERLLNAAREFLQDQTKLPALHKELQPIQAAWQARLEQVWSEMAAFRAARAGNGKS